MVQPIQHMTIEGERPLFGQRDIEAVDWYIGPGESALKQCQHVHLSDCRVDGMYVLWECKDVHCDHVTFNEGARALSWYGQRHSYDHCHIHAPKAFRELTDIQLADSVLTDAAEAFWKCRNGRINRVQMQQAEYAFLHAEHWQIDHLQLQGKYIFQYAKQIEIHHAQLDTKDAFWESEDCTVYDSVIRGEYVGWYSRNLRLVRCRIAGTQPLCYCKNLQLEDCLFDADADRCFEHSEVNGSIIGQVTSITPPMTGQIVYK